MARFIIVVFGFLAFAFYEMSGGADFDAEATRLSRIELPPAVVEQPLERVAEVETLPSVSEDVTRVSLNLTSVNDVLRPQRTVRTTPARERPAIEEADTLIGTVVRGQVRVRAREEVGGEKRR